MTRSIIIILFFILGLSIPVHASKDDEPSNLSRASIALKNLAEQPNLERLTCFNEFARPLANEDLAKLNSVHLQKVVSLPLGYKLYDESHAIDLGMTPAIQEELKQSLILWAKLRNYIEPHMKETVLYPCVLYRAWYDNEYPDASAAIKQIREHYHVDDKTIPVWQLYFAMPLKDKIPFHAATMYSLPASNVYIRCSIIPFLAVIAYLYIM